MGRKPTVNFNLPPGMRRRIRPSGKIYFFYDQGGKSRKEIPLGTDYITALKKYADLNIVTSSTIDKITFLDIAKRYKAEEIAKKAQSTQITQLSDIKHLEKWFGHPPAPLHKIRPVHINQFLRWMRYHPTTANRCKRLFSHIWNMARAWGYIDLSNPAIGIQGYSLSKRDVYIDDAIYALVHEHGSPTLKDAMDLIYFCGRRPGDAMRLTDHDIVDGELWVRQSKTKAPLRIQIIDELAALLLRIRERKAKFKVVSMNLLINERGRKLTKGALRYHFDQARKAAKEAHPELADKINQFWLYDLRAKAADDIADQRGEQAVADLLGHTDVRTTKRHYLRKGKKVVPTR